MSGSAVPLGAGMEMWHRCRFGKSNMLRALGDLSGCLRRFVPCGAGANHCRLKWVQASGVDLRNCILVLSGYLPDLNDRMGVPRKDDENQAMSGDLVPEKEGASGLIVRGHIAGRRDGSDQHLPGRRGHHRQHQRNPDSDRLHCRTRRNAVAAEPVPSLGMNRNSTATDKAHTEA